MKSKTTTDRKTRDNNLVMPALEGLRLEGDQVVLLSTERKNAMKTFYGQEIPQHLDTPEGTLRRAAYHLVLQAGGHANLDPMDFFAVGTLHCLADQVKF